MEYHRPTDLNDALELLADGRATVLAGGTDLRLQIDAGRRSYGARLVNIRAVAGLSRIEVAEGTVTIGALATISDIRRSGALQQTAPVLASAADAFASDQIRNAGTLGGNLCNASPAGDMAVPLLLLDARVVVQRLSGNARSQRTLDLSDFLLGPGHCALKPQEMLSHVEFAVPPAGFRSKFRKSGPRPALEISIVSAAASAAVDENGRWTGARVAMGAVAATAMRATEAEAMLEGAIPDDALLRRAAAVAAASSRPIDDMRASVWYRRRLIEVFMGELFDDIRAG